MTINTVELARAQKQLTIPAVTLTAPYKDPNNTYRATSVQQMFYLVPSLPQRTNYIFDDGTPSNIQSIIYSIQNNTVNNKLAVTASIPSFLVIDSPLKFIINPGEINNVKVSFNDKAAELLLPRHYLTSISFDVFPIDVTGPVFVDKSAVPPPNLNLAPSVTSSVTSSLPHVVYKYITIEVPPPPADTTPKLFWKDGTTGDIKSGSPPAGWTIEADGAAYPPIEPPNACGGPSGGPSNGETDAKALYDEVSKIPLAKPAATRQAVILTASDISNLIPSDVNDITVNGSIPIWIIDVGPGPMDIKIQNYAKKTFGGTIVNPTSNAIPIYLSALEQAVGILRASAPLPPANNIFNLLVALSVAEVHNLGGRKIPYSGIEEVGTYSTTTGTGILANAYQHAFNSADKTTQNAYKGMHYKVATNSAAIYFFLKNNNI